MNEYYLKDLSEELYSLNENIQTLTMVLAEALGKPLEYISSNGNFKFQDEEGK